MAVARPADLRAARGVVVALPATDTGGAAGPTSRVREKFATRPASGPLRKRPPPPSSTSSSSAPPSSSSRPPAPPPPHRKRTRDGGGIPLSICQGCRVDTGSFDALEVVQSNWRSLLLCSDCFRAVRSKDACAYCFQNLTGEYPRRRVVDCVDCQCRVHLVCIPGQRGFITPYDMDPSLFSCVDCSPIPKFFQPSTVRRPKPNCSPAVVKGTMKDFVTDANAFLQRKAIIAELAKQKAMDKAEAAEMAADQAKDAYDYALVACQGSHSSSTANDEPMPLRVPDDEELALRLHLAMNGSQRVSRSQRQNHHRNPSFHSKRAVANGYLTPPQKVGAAKTSNLHRQIIKVQSDDDSDCVNIDGCVEARPLDIKPYAEQPSSTPSLFLLTYTSSRHKDASARKDKIVVPVTQEPRVSQENESASSSAQENGADSGHLSSSSSSSDESKKDQDLAVQGVEGLVEKSCIVDVPVLLDESSLPEVRQKSNPPDRYLKKYTRNHKLRRTLGSKESDITGPSPVLGKCSTCSNASKDFSSASFDVTVLTVDASANVRGSSECQ